MPAVSQAQRGWAFGSMGEDWAREHHFDNPGKLPAYVGSGPLHHSPPEGHLQDTHQRILRAQRSHNLPA